MPTKSFTPIRGKRIRVTQLDDCGAIIPTSQQIVTEGFVTVSLSPQVEDGTEITLRNASGAICISERGNPTFTGFDVEITFCDVNPSLLSFVTNAEDYEDYSGDIAGFTVPEGEITGKFALELWTGIAGVACGDDGAEASGYMLLPLINAGTLADMEIGGEDAITFGLTSASTRGGNTWGVGPYNVLLDAEEESAPAPLPTALDPLDHLLMVETFVAPPPSADEPSMVPTPEPDPEP